MDEIGVWLGGGGGEKIGGAALFSMGPPKLYHPKLGRKHKGKQVTHFWTIALSQHKHSSLCLLSCLSFSWIFLMLSFVSSFFLLPPLFSILCSLVFSYLSFGTLSSFFFFFLFFGMWAWFCFVFLLLLLIFLKDSDFFLYMIFIFNTFGWLLFFFFLELFFTFLF